MWSAPWGKRAETGSAFRRNRCKGTMFFSNPFSFFLLFHVHIYTLKELSNLVKRNEKHLLSQVAITSKRAASWFEDAALIMLDGGRLHNYHRIFYIFS